MRATGIMPKQDAPRGFGGMGRGNQSRTEQQVESMDWAFAQNADKTSPFYQKIDTKNICISGMSCGGLQALFNCFDPRVTSIMICNSGLFEQPEGDEGGTNARRMPGMPSVPKAKLKEIHCPIIYILGGETDIAGTVTYVDVELEGGTPMINFPKVGEVLLTKANLGTRTLMRVKQPSRSFKTSTTITLVPETQSGNTPQGKMFAGKTIDQLNPKNGGLEGLIAANKSNLSVKKVFEALQGAEDVGVPINYDKVNTDLQALLNADKAQVKQLRDALIHEIQGC